MFAKIRLLTVLATLGIVVVCNGADHQRDLRALRGCHAAVSASTMHPMSKFTLLNQIKHGVNEGIECACKHASAKLESSLVKHKDRLEQEQNRLVSQDKKSKTVKKLRF